MTETNPTASETAQTALSDWHAGRHDAAFDTAEAATRTGDEAAMGLLVQLSGLPEAKPDFAARTRAALDTAPAGVMRDRHRAYFRAAGIGADRADWNGALADRMAQAEAGDWVALTELGLLAVMTGDAATGRAWLEQAGKSGSGLAIAALMRESLEAGERFACLDTLGQGLANSGHPMAGGLMHRCAQLPAAATGTSAPPPDDPDAVLARMAASLEAPVGEPDRLHDSPRIDRWPATLAPSACDYLTVGAAPLLKPAQIINPQTGQLENDPYRSSLTAPMPEQAMDLVSWAIKCRMAALSGQPPRHGEALAVIVYRPGEEYRAHFDFILDSKGQAARDIARRGQRIATSLVRLNEEFTGGDTVFPRIDVRWTGKRGDGLSFDNVDADGSCHKASLHAGEPVSNGVKVIASLWLRERI
ncbi:2OG-Fe(II) oxygenase [Maricaulis sp.]|uniref:prolyl hydroxylase family protein n=1 Tax=Maricaulis sp. TaxID=1486257 RepID=UPI002B276909|nr:2OG-Fe(II) oxygenase [Maricaulis sp.]